MSFLSAHKRPILLVAILSVAVSLAYVVRDAAPSTAWTYGPYACGATSNETTDCYSLTIDANNLCTIDYRPSGTACTPKPGDYTPSPCYDVTGQCSNQGVCMPVSTPKGIGTACTPSFATSSCPGGFQCVGDAYTQVCGCPVQPASSVSSAFSSLSSSSAPSCGNGAKEGNEECDYKEGRFTISSGGVHCADGGPCCTEQCKLTQCGDTKNNDVNQNFTWQGDPDETDEGDPACDLVPESYVYNLPKYYAPNKDSESDGDTIHDGQTVFAATDQTGGSFGQFADAGGSALRWIGSVFRNLTGAITPPSFKQRRAACGALGGGQVTYIPSILFNGADTAVLCYCYSNKQPNGNVNDPVTGSDIKITCTGNVNGRFIFPMDASKFYQDIKDLGIEDRYKLGNCTAVPSDGACQNNGPVFTGTVPSRDNYGALSSYCGVQCRNWLADTTFTSTGPRDALLEWCQTSCVCGGQAGEEASRKVASDVDKQITDAMKARDKACADAKAAAYKAGNFDWECNATNLRSYETDAQIKQRLQADLQKKQADAQKKAFETSTKNGDACYATCMQGGFGDNVCGSGDPSCCRAYCVNSQCPLPKSYSSSGYQSQFGGPSGGGGGGGGGTTAGGTTGGTTGGGTSSAASIEGGSGGTQGGAGGNQGGNSGGTTGGGGSSSFACPTDGCALNNNAGYSYCQSQGLTCQSITALPCVKCVGGSSSARSSSLPASSSASSLSSSRASSVSSLRISSVSSSRTSSSRSSERSSSARSSSRQSSVSFSQSSLICIPGTLCTNGAVCKPDGTCPELTIIIAPPSSASSMPGISLLQHCGNGIIDADEECDDGNLSNNDTCSTSCRLQAVSSSSAPLFAFNPDRPGFNPLFCGNGDLNTGEECDLGAKNSDLPNASCRTDCTVTRCGDGIVDGVLGEACDDGNSNQGDGCFQCRVEQQAGQPNQVLPGSLIELPFVPGTPIQGSVIPTNPKGGPIGDTGPETVAIMAAGASAGYTYLKMKRRK